MPRDDLNPPLRHHRYVGNSCGWAVVSIRSPIRVSGTQEEPSFILIILIIEEVRETEGRWGWSHLRNHYIGFTEPCLDYYRC